MPMHRLPSVLAPASISLPFNRLVVFGDSYSDTGHNFNLTQGKFPPSPPYDKKYSNGPVWCEYLAKNLGLTLENYAEGGATTDNNFVQGHTSPANLPVNGIYQQIQKVYLPTNPSTASTALYALFSSGNDFHVDKLLSANHSALNLLRAVSLLRSSLPTARHFLLFRSADLGNLPYFHPQAAGLFHHPFRSTLERGVATTVSAKFNENLNAYTREYKQKNPEIELTVFETDKLFSGLDKQGEKYGFQNVKQQCVALDGRRFVPQGEIASHFYWDSVHVTTKGHELLAGEVAKALGEVYEGKA
ncbi:GDSL lipase/esterase [Jimgerdemannia flammicorona]|uniref:GDSL lipase/esterase n=1 Tax=Jimgerdemannia flammicorona TaxID=994334 RepID=A0A433DJE8_9FUNG|nr:GDSL lipase/esterase [Jimgerdemannia flammicorona]